MNWILAKDYLGLMWCPSFPQLKFYSTINSNFCPWVRELITRTYRERNRLRGRKKRENEKEKEREREREREREKRAL